MPEEYLFTRETAPYLPKMCFDQKCRVLRVIDGTVRIYHNDAFLEIPWKHIHDPHYDIWGRDLKPWLEKQHA